MDKKNVCACGLNCYDCMFNKTELYDSANQLQKLLTESQMSTFLSIMSKKEVNAKIARHLNTDPESFNNYFKMSAKFPDFLEILKGLTEIQCKITCRESGGCSMCGETKECSAIKCVKEKDLEGCWDCPEHKSCSRLEFQRASYGRTVDENFHIIKSRGMTAVPSRGDDYYEWQRMQKKDSQSF